MTFELLLLNRKMAELNQKLRNFDRMIEKIKKSMNKLGNGEFGCIDFVRETRDTLEMFEIKHGERVDTSRWIGKWNSRDRTHISIENEFEMGAVMFLFGYIQINSNQRLASVWDSEGNNLGNSNYDLIERQRPGRGL